jgi:3-hydroxyacyl-CoA dehydrogenase/enoyl-CoA hydratase/3-hydroxybutyryl-CoA epimerase/3-hydroxyacyl-CoA dehydrogenase/enoyl-CoA hydratase/3-hydroxybutyryl-CoA epimerase/enoyl-CoA isomerase
MAESSILSLTMQGEDVAVITLDDPAKGANVLSSSVLDDLEKLLDQLDAQVGLAGLVLVSGKPGMFIAGADLREFVQWIDSPDEEVTAFCRRGQTLFGRLATADYVTVAAIDGLCVGGGAELAMWCDRRIFTDGPKTGYGFPEVKLGLFPGWGGTARTPRMVGLSNAVELVTGGESIDARAAQLMGLSQDTTSAERLLDAAIAMIRAEQQSGDYLADRAQWSGPIEISETELGFLGATASAYIQQQTKGRYPAPLHALELMLGSVSLDLESACQAEAAAFAEVFGSPVNRSLLNVFFLQDANKKDRGVEDELERAEIDSVSVVGAGVMGQGIAAANLKRGIPVTITDTRKEALTAGLAAVLEEVSYNKTIKGPDVERAVRFAPLLSGGSSSSEVGASDLVIEAVVENLDIKRTVLHGIEAKMGEKAILASNTSTIPITQLAAGLKSPENFCGIHFFNPVRKMPLVEVIRGEKTSDHTVASAVAFVKRIGKSPIVVEDGPGFLVNRLLFPYMNEALQLLVEGASIKQVDRAAKAFGMPMGPIALFDVVGLDVALHAGRVMHEAFPDRFADSPLLAELVEAGRLGQKSGEGFFSYKNKKRKGQDDPAVAEAIARHATEPREFEPNELSERLFLPMLLEATRVLEAELVRTPQDVDLGLIYGIGFPPFQGGLLFWADTLGAAKIIEMLEPYQSLGVRYQATELLQQMAADGRKFYD